MIKFEDHQVSELLDKEIPNQAKSDHEISVGIGWSRIIIIVTKTRIEML